MALGASRHIPANEQLRRHQAMRWPRNWILWMKQKPININRHQQTIATVSIWGSSKLSALLRSHADFTSMDFPVIYHQWRVKKCSSKENPHCLFCQSKTPWFAHDSPWISLSASDVQPSFVVGPCKQWSRIHDRWAMELLVLKRLRTPSNFTTIEQKYAETEPMTWEYCHTHPRSDIWFDLQLQLFPPRYKGFFMIFFLLKCPNLMILFPWKTSN